MWSAPLQFVPTPGSHTQSSELLSPGEDHAMGFETPSIVSTQRGHKTSLTNQVPVADYRSTSVISVESVSSIEDDRDLVSFPLLPFHCYSTPN